MAKPIKETPVLRGKEAERFITEVKKYEQVKVSASEVERGRIMHERMIHRTRCG